MDGIVVVKELNSNGRLFWCEKPCTMSGWLGPLGLFACAVALKDSTKVSLLCLRVANNLVWWQFVPPFCRGGPGLGLSPL